MTFGRELWNAKLAVSRLRAGTLGTGAAFTSAVEAEQFVALIQELAVEESFQLPLGASSVAIAR